MFNIVTIAREYGSGGAEVGRCAANMLGWELLDRQIIERVAAIGKIDQAWAEKADEQSSGWWERVLSGFRYGGSGLYLGNVWEAVVDRDLLQRFTTRVIEAAGKTGNCVIVGRSSQCVLRKNPRALHVLVYAPLEEKVERVKRLHPNDPDLSALLRRMDAERQRYTQDYFGCDSRDRGLYQLCINSTLGVDACAELIVNAIRLPEKKQILVNEKTIV